MDRNQQAEFAKLKNPACHWSNQVRCGRLHAASKTWFALHDTVMKSLEYLLMATALTQSQWNKLMRTLLRQHYCGYKSRCPSQMLPGSHLAATTDKASHLWTTQGLEKLWSIFHRGDADTITGQKICCSLEYTMLETGIPNNLLVTCAI